MQYATTTHQGRNFLCIKNDEGIEISTDERTFILQNIPINTEWTEGVWDTETDVSKICEEKGMVNGEDAIRVLTYMKEHGYLSLDDDDDEEFDED